MINENGVSASNADNKVVYDYKKKIWVLVSDNTFKKRSNSNHLVLFYVQSKNASGFLTVNENTKLKSERTGAVLYFCVVHKDYALCGTGKQEAIESKFNIAKEVLKLLESISFDEN